MLSSRDVQDVIDELIRAEIADGNTVKRSAVVDGRLLRLYPEPRSVKGQTKEFEFILARFDYADRMVVLVNKRFREYTP